MCVGRSPAPQVKGMSHVSPSRHAAGGTERPAVIDDLYVFPGEGSTVFVLDVNSNITGVYAQPGFHPEARYEFKVRFDGADYEALTYRVAFGEPGAGRQQTRG